MMIPILPPDHPDAKAWKLIRKMLEVLKRYRTPCQSREGKIGG